jgi:hypothetical protein
VEVILPHTVNRYSSKEVLEQIERGSEGLFPSAPEMFLPFSSQQQFFSTFCPDRDSVVQNKSLALSHLSSFARIFSKLLHAVLFPHEPFQTRRVSDSKENEALSSGTPKSSLDHRVAYQIVSINPDDRTAMIMPMKRKEEIENALADAWSNSASSSTAGGNPSLFASQPVSYFPNSFMFRVPFASSPVFVPDEMIDDGVGNENDLILSGSSYVEKEGVKGNEFSLPPAFTFGPSSISPPDSKAGAAGPKSPELHEVSLFDLRLEPSVMSTEKEIKNAEPGLSRPLSQYEYSRFIPHFKKVDANDVADACTRPPFLPIPSVWDPISLGVLVYCLLFIWM